jgi:hypothetical protein
METIGKGESGGIQRQLVAEPNHKDLVLPLLTVCTPSSWSKLNQVVINQFIAAAQSPNGNDRVDSSCCCHTVTRVKSPIHYSGGDKATSGCIRVLFRNDTSHWIERLAGRL